jgi:hypothetical protein
MKPHKILQFLFSWGWTQARIAEKIGLSQTMVNHLASQKRKQTNYESGHRLMSLYASEKLKHTTQKAPNE